MIDYKFPEEREILFHYAKKLQADEVIAIINRGHVENAVEAKQLSAFFWRMVDESVKDAEQGLDVAGCSDLQAHTECIMQTLRRC